MKTSYNEAIEAIIASNNKLLEDMNLNLKMSVDYNTEEVVTMQKGFIFWKEIRRVSFEDAILGTKIN